MQVRAAIGNTAAAATAAAKSVRVCSELLASKYWTLTDSDNVPFRLVTTKLALIQLIRISLRVYSMHVLVIILSA